MRSKGTPPIPHYPVPRRIRSRRQYVMWTKRAAAILVQKYRYRADDFIRIADTEPSLNWCPLYPRHWERENSSWLEKLPRNAIVYWPDGTDICGDGHDPEDPIILLADIQYWEKDFVYREEEEDDAYQPD